MKHLSRITLEIYVVQYILIEELRSWVGFPLNWLVLTGAILLCAVILHTICKGIYKCFDRITGNVKQV